MLKDDNPDKGTETESNLWFICDSDNKGLKDDNPDKGTETMVFLFLYIL